MGTLNLGMWPRGRGSGDPGGGLGFIIPIFLRLAQAPSPPPLPYPFSEMPVWTITSARSTVIAAEVVVSVMSLNSAPPCIYYKQNKLNRLVHDDPRQLEWDRAVPRYRKRTDQKPPRTRHF